MMFVSLGIGTVVAVALIVVMSILTGASAKPSSVPTSNNANSSSLPTSALVGKTVKGFSLSGLNGGTEQAPWATGHASVLIFFASWCGPCKSEMPKVASYLRAHDQSPVVVMGIDVIDSRSAAQSFVAKDGVRFPVASDPAGNVTNGIFQFATVPETVFVSAKGVVTKVFYGAIPTDALVSGIAKLKSAA